MLMFSRNECTLPCLPLYYEIWWTSPLERSKHPAAPPPPARSIGEPLDHTLALIQRVSVLGLTQSTQTAFFPRLNLGPDSRAKEGLLFFLAK